MERSRSNRIKRFAVGLLLLAIPAVFIASINTLTAQANKNSSPGQTSINQSLLDLHTIEFILTGSSISEGGGTASIDVEIDPGIITPSLEIYVEYLTVDGTAKEPGDYEFTSGVLTFTMDSPNDRETIMVDIVDDNIDEPNETFSVVLRNPVGAVLGDNDVFVLTIQDNDPTPTNTPSTQPTATPIYVDRFEPNNNIQNAYPIQAGAGTYCNLTLWPIGDEDYFRFGVKAGLAYEVTTSNLSPGLDTVLRVFNSQGTPIGTNDDYEQGNRGSQVVFSVFTDGYYYARVSNVSTEDPANKTYCIEVTEIEGTPTNTPIPTGTRVPGADDCEENGSIGSACLIGPGTTYDMNFVPLFGEGPDNDFYRMWIKQGIFYSCETLALSSVNDTNMILYDQNGNGLGGNDDKELGDRGSKVDYYATYTGWLYVLVGPVAIPDYGLSYLYTYSLICEEDVPTPTVTPTPTFVVSTGGTGGTSGGGGVSIPTPTTFVFPTFPATPTPFTTPQPTSTPDVQVNPLPTETPLGGQTTQEININLTVYYDANNDFMPDLTEGVEGVAVAIYDNNTNDLLAFGNTNEAGMIHFGPLLVTGPVRISIPYLQFNQITVGDSNILIRIAPWPAAPGAS
jgi:hypothetical protein